MATGGTSIKDRCRLCYTRLKDTLSSHHKLWCSQHHQRVYNIYKRRPYRYRDLIGRYLCIRLPENESQSNENQTLDHYSHVVCGTCAVSLNKLDSAFRTFQQLQKNLRSKFRKTSQIVHYQLKNSPPKLTQQKSHEIKEQEVTIPKRQSKRKGAPKHIDQTINHPNKKPTGGVQLIVKIHSPDQVEHEVVQEAEDETDTSVSLPSKRTSPRRKPYPINELDKNNPKKKFKRLTKDDDIDSNCMNLLKPSILTDISMKKKGAPLKLTASSGSPSSNSRSNNSVKGNHIERIAVSLLSVNDRREDILQTCSFDIYF